MKKELTLLAIAMAISYSCAFGQSSLKIISNGNVGVSTDNPLEKLQVNGAINIGNTTINIPGSIRWNGSDFEGFDGEDWKSLTKCDCEMTEEENGSSSNSDSNSNNESDSNSDDSSEENTADNSEENTSSNSDAGCESGSTISTQNANQVAGWANQMNTEELGFSGAGEICYTISSYEGNTTQMIGLSENADASVAYEDINYAFYHRIASTLNSHRVYVWENNERKGIFLNESTSYEGSTFCIRRNEDSEVEYYINDELVYTSETTSDAPLYFDNSFYGYAEGSSSIWNHQPSNIEVSDISVCSEELANLVAGEVGLSQLQQEGIGILSQNVPNPFIDRSVISYDLSGEIYSKAELVITNSLGQMIRQETLKSHVGQFDVSRASFAKGIYQYTVVLDGQAMDTKQMVVE